MSPRETYAQTPMTAVTSKIYNTDHSDGNISQCGCLLASLSYSCGRLTFPRYIPASLLLVPVEWCSAPINPPQLAATTPVTEHSPMDVGPYPIGAHALIGVRVVTSKTPLPRGSIYPNKQARQ